MTNSLILPGAAHLHHSDVYSPSIDNSVSHVVPTSSIEENEIFESVSSPKRRKRRSNSKEQSKFVQNVEFTNATHDSSCAELPHDSCNDQKNTLSTAHPLLTVTSLTIEHLREKLKTYFRFDDFLPGQLEVVQSVLHGRSVIALLPTGSGKSLCYQLPVAILREHHPSCFCLVISPLVSLMHDQVGHLPASIPGVVLTGSRKTENVFNNIRSRKCAVVFTSPERFSTDQIFLQGLLQIRELCAFVCVDEAHCISQWGYEFRPSYLGLCSRIQEILTATKPILATTATATCRVTQDLQRMLKPCSVVSQLSLRTNLLLHSHLLDTSAYGSVFVENSFLFQKRLDLLLSILQSVNSSESIIIYVSTQRLSEEVATFLAKQHTFLARCYHAGMSRKNRMECQSSFLKNDTQIVVATVAFGMGIHKPDVRAVIHFYMPSSIEEYIQEIGRAGRDGKISHCHVIIDRATYANHLRRFIAPALDCPHAEALCVRLMKPSHQRSKVQYPFEAALDVSDLSVVADVDESHVMGICYILYRMLPSALRIGPCRASLATLCARRSQSFRKSILSSACTKDIGVSSILNQLAIPDYFLSYMQELEGALQTGAAQQIDLYHACCVTQLQYDNLSERLRQYAKERNLYVRFYRPLPSVVLSNDVQVDTLSFLSRNLVRALSDRRALDFTRLDKLYRILLSLFLNQDSEKSHESLSHYMSSLRPSCSGEDDISDNYMYMLNSQTISNENESCVRSLVKSAKELTLSPIQYCKVLYGISTPSIHRGIGCLAPYWCRLSHLAFDSVLTLVQEVVNAC